MNFEILLSTLEKLGLNKTAEIDNKIKDSVCEGMIHKFGEIIPQKMLEAGVDVDCHVIPSEKQAEYFFEALSSFDEKN